MPVKIVITQNEPIEKNNEELYNCVLNSWIKQHNPDKYSGVHYYKIAPQYVEAMQVSNLVFKNTIWYLSVKGTETEVNRIDKLFERIDPIYLHSSGLKDKLIQAGYKFIFKTSLSTVYASKRKPCYGEKTGYRMLPDIEPLDISWCSEEVEGLQSKDSLIRLRD